MLEDQLDRLNDVLERVVNAIETKSQLEALDRLQKMVDELSIKTAALEGVQPPAPAPAGVTAPRKRRTKSTEAPTPEVAPGVVTGPEPSVATSEPEPEPTALPEPTVESQPIPEPPSEPVAARTESDGGPSLTLDDIRDLGRKLITKDGNSVRFREVLAKYGATAVPGLTSADLVAVHNDLAELLNA